MEDVMKTESKEQSFEVVVLDQQDLAKVSGGLLATQDTHSVCHQDGTTDND